MHILKIKSYIYQREKLGKRFTYMQINGVRYDFERYNLSHIKMSCHTI